MRLYGVLGPTAVGNFVGKSSGARWGKYTHYYITHDGTGSVSEKGEKTGK